MLRSQARRTFRASSFSSDTKGSHNDRASERNRGQGFLFIQNLVKLPMPKAYNGRQDFYAFTTMKRFLTLIPELTFLVRTFTPLLFFIELSSFLSAKKKEILSDDSVSLKK